jgi:hypothetical protein
MNDLLHAWITWFGGNTPDTLWGIQIRWWARIGQIVQFVSATVIVFEIIGLERSRSISISFSNLMDIPGGEEIVKESYAQHS